VTRVVRRGGPEERPSETKPLPSVALDMLYRNEQRALVRFFTRYRASPDEAHDLTQETFLRMVRADADGPGTILRPAQYLRHIARNLLKDRARAAHRQSADAHVDAANINLPGTDELARLEARDSLGRLDAAMALLKPKTREIFMARHVEGLSHAEIAARIGLSVSGVEKQIALAFEQIHRLTGLP
jgi:RNA polymerase sigma factor (sigma-70 family)